MHRIQQKNLPLVVYGAGLPTILSKVGKIKTYSERLFDYPQINALTEEETYEALQIPIQKEGGGYTLNALKHIYTWSAGYPYFIQVWGKVTWDKAPSVQIAEDTVKACRDKVTTDLDNGFYRVRYEQLTNKEKQYIKAMAELGTGSQSSLDIAKHLKKDPAAVSVVRGKLIAKGVIYSPEYSKLAFTVPLFDEFVRRNM